MNNGLRLFKLIIESFFFRPLFLCQSQLSPLNLVLPSTEVQTVEFSLQETGLKKIKVS